MNATRWVLLAVVAAIGVGGTVLWMQSAPEKPQPAAEPAPPPAQTESHYPAPEPENKTIAAEPLPELDGSDSAVHGALAEALGKQPVDSFLVPTEFIRHFVAFVDS